MILVMETIRNTSINLRNYWGNPFYFKTISARQHYFKGLDLRLQAERTGNNLLIEQAMRNKKPVLFLESNAAFAFNEKGILYRRLSKFKEAAGAISTYY